MPEDIVIDMPTDLHSTGVHKFELESDTLARSRGIAALTVRIPHSRRSRQGDAPSLHPRWKTPEFLFYFAVVAVVLPYMAWVPIRLSSRMSGIISRV